MTTRRRFLVLCGTAGTGIFLVKTGLIELPRRMVLQLAGRCAFCGKERREVFGIAGVVGKEPRICDECIGLCFDILGEEIENIRERGMTTQWEDDDLERLLRAASTEAGADPREIIEENK